ncbi:MAG: anhydro-N-acetylmuramic acid kinase [Gammaproteobacteria bacterium]|nr:anhydro-N-acetylmuramic acid kinase [Gammaproteobacteria bacterium]
MSELFIGLMSGTSMDGIDAALVNFENETIQLLGHHSHTLPQTLKDTLFKLSLNHPDINLDILGQADAELGNIFADAVMELLAKYNIQAKDIKAIGSHGQTIRHKPDLEFPFTLQIGDANRIAYKTGITTVADFRRKDMAAGGQGAPLTPAFHNAVFRSASENRAVLNIGGIANITCLPADPDQNCFGFDTGPGNMLMDSWISQHKQQPYDKNGEWSASTQANNELLNQLMRDEFIHLNPPKSTGREHYNIDWLNTQLIKFPKLSASTIQATLCAFTAQSISYAIKKFLPEITSLIICGGGVHNKFLMHQLDTSLSNINIAPSDQYNLPADWVEAVAFAWLAKQTIEGKPGNLPAVTGAKQSTILGAIYPVS